MRSNFAPPLVPRTLSTVRLTSAKTPMPDRISHRTAMSTTPAMPTATDSRNDIFMTDHGSTRETVSLTRRAAAGRGAPPVAAPVAPAGRAPPGSAEVLMPSVGRSADRSAGRFGDPAGLLASGRVAAPD